MRSLSHLRRILGVLLFLGLVLGAGLWLSRRTFGPLEGYERVLQDDVPIGGAFTLSSVAGETITPSSFPGKYLFIYFGYTFCPDICPTGLGHMRAALQQLSPEVRSKVQAVFITIDPERDTAESLARFMKDYPGILALTGSAAEVQNAIEAYKVYAAKRFHDGNTADPYYLMDHSSLVYLMDPTGRYVGHATHASSAEDMAHLLEKYVR